MEHDRKDGSHVAQQLEINQSEPFEMDDFQYGSTKKDRKDMWRMGKRQELIVMQSLVMFVNPALTDISLEKF